LDAENQSLSKDLEECCNISAPQQAR
jgi:hypothetical protein